MDIKLCFLLFFFSACSTLTIPEQEKAASNLLAEIEEFYTREFKEIHIISEGLSDIPEQIRSSFGDFYKRLKTFDYRNFQNEQLKRQIEMILKGTFYPPISPKYFDSLLILKRSGKAKVACNRGAYRGGRCKMPYVPDIKRILSSKDSNEELIYYWTEWRNKITPHVRDSFNFFVEYYKNSTQYGVSKPSDLWYIGFDEPNFIDELTEVMNALHKHLYVPFHALVRHVLHQKYGDSVISPTGLIPHHLAENVELQAWTRDSIMVNPYPEKKLPDLEADMNKNGITARNIVEKSVEFFTSLGIQNLTEDFWKHNIHVQQHSDCRSEVYDFGQIYFSYCDDTHFKKVLQIHGDMAKLFYAIEKGKLPFGLNEEACPGFSNALGEAAILSVSTPKHIQQMGLLIDYDYDDELSMNRLFRQAIHTLLTIPEYFVNEKLWVDIIDGKIKPEEYNCAYWKLMEEFAGIEPPVERNNSYLDFGYRFYEGIVNQNLNTRKVLSEFLGYQIYRSLCEKSGEFVRGDAYLPLQNCDFYKKKEAGKFLNEIMTSGAKKKWRETMEGLVGTTKLTAAALLEFYDPLSIWLEEQNAENNIPVGWKPTNKCKSN